MSSPALAAYLLASRLADPLAVPVLRWRLARGKEDSARLPERLGRPGLPRPKGSLVWLHAASVGEATSALPLIDALRGCLDAAILLTTGTLTSARRMAGALPAGAVHQFAPVDTHRAVRRFLDHWRPDMALWIESEIWPNLLHEIGRRKIPSALVNARMSAGSFRKWSRVPGFIGPLLKVFRLCLTQTEMEADRLRRLGVRRA